MAGRPIAAIDMHTHMYPSKYIKYLQSRVEYPKIIEDPREGLVIWDYGVRAGHVKLPDHVDPEHRIKVVGRHGIATQVVTLTAPGVHRFGEESVKWAKEMNDYLAHISDKWKDKYVGFATLPLNYVGESVDELKRAVEELGLRGVMLFTNVNGVYISDKRFEPIFESVARLDIPILLHAVTPPEKLLAAVSDYSIPISLWPYLYDETIAATKLVWDGVLDRFPTLKIILAHLGSFLPLHFERIDYAAKMYAREYGYELRRASSEYFIKQCYYDTANFYRPAVEFVMKIVGADKIVFGTDYPHRVGDPERAIESILGMNATEEEKERILRRNAEKLLKLT